MECSLAQPSGLLCLVKVVAAEHEEAVAAAGTKAVAAVKATSTMPWTRTEPLTTAPAMTKAGAWHADE